MTDTHLSVRPAAGKGLNRAMFKVPAMDGGAFREILPDPKINCGVIPVRAEPRHGRSVGPLHQNASLIEPGPVWGPTGRVQHP
jgi:hypothetical protein